MKNRNHLPSVGQRKRIFGRRQNQSGQIVIEFVLLLSIAFIISAIMIRALVSGGGSTDPGTIIRVWTSMVATIGSDNNEDLTR